MMILSAILLIVLLFGLNIFLVLCVTKDMTDEELDEFYKNLNQMPWDEKL